MCLFNKIRFRFKCGNIWFGFVLGKHKGADFTFGVSVLGVGGWGGAHTHEAVISYVFALLFLAGFHRSLALARPVPVDVIRANSERRSAVSRRRSSFSNTSL